MAKIQSVKKLIVEDFSSASRELIQRLAAVLNPFLDQVVTALSQKITFADNLKCKTYNFTLAEGISSIVVAWDFNEKPTAVYIGNLTKSNGQAPSAVFALSSYHSDRKLTLTFLGLDASTAHTVTVIAQI
jgi:hypothetical protein